MNNLEARKQALELFSQLKTERATFDQHWQEIADNMSPRRLKMQANDRNKGDKRNQKIKDETPLHAIRTLRAGMMGGLTSPSRPWFALTTANPIFRDDMQTKMWLHHVTQLMMAVFIRSNLYHALPIAYGDVAVFGTAAIGVDELLDGSVMHFQPFPVGSYYISTGADGKVNVFAREFELTARQVVERYGMGEKEINWKNISMTTRSLYENNQRESAVRILQVISPNDQWNPKDPASFKYNSIHIEYSAEDDRVLRKGGYQYFPVLVPRWEVSGNDMYGTSCPGMEALPSVKLLHTMELRAIQAVEKMLNPPLIGPKSLQHAKVSAIPGDMNYVDERQGMLGLRPLYEVRYDLGAHEAKAEQIRGRVRKAFFEDMFLMFQALEQRDRVTAAEINARREEKLLVLGPVLERLNQDLFDPLIGIAFTLMARQGLIPPPPEQLSEQPLKIEYVSIMHQAQKSAGLAGLDRLKAHAMEVAQLSPEALDKFNFDNLTDEYADILGVPPHMVYDDETVAKIREQRAIQQAQQEAQMQQQANAQMLLEAQKQ